MHALRVIVPVVIAALATASGAHAQLAISANDNKVVLEDGVVKVVPNPASDTISLIDLKASPPRVVETLTVGQTPEGLKVSPDNQHVAVVVMNGSNKPRSSPFYNDNGKLVIVRVGGASLAKVAEARIGHWSQGAAFSPDGKTILVGNMVEKDVQVFAWDGKALREVTRLKVGGGSAALRTVEK